MAEPHVPVPDKKTRAIPSSRVRLVNNPQSKPMKNPRNTKAPLKKERKQDGGDVSMDSHHDDNRINAFDPEVARAIGSLKHQDT